MESSLCLLQKEKQVMPCASSDRLTWRTHSSDIAAQSVQDEALRKALTGLASMDLAKH